MCVDGDIRDVQQVSRALAMYGEGGSIGLRLRLAGRLAEQLRLLERGHTCESVESM